MTRRTLPRLPSRALAAATATVVCSSCAIVGATAAPSSPPPTTSSPPQTTSSSTGTVAPIPANPGARYIAAIDAVVAHGARVWVETDLVKRWLQGPASFQAALAIVVALAARPGVEGVKIADELGYHDGLSSPDQAQRFLDDAATGIRAHLPHTKILIDMVVPDLGCLPWRTDLGAWSSSCATLQRQATPAAALAAADRYLHSGDVDVLDLSVGLLSDAQYRVAGLTRDDAMRQAWAEVRAMGWPALVRLQARKALAHPGIYEESAAQAERDLHTYIDIPLASGASAVDVWTWRQTYRGSIYRLMDPGLVDNALWAGLRERRREGMQLWTHLTPSSLEVGLQQDVSVLTSVMTAVFVAAGTG